MWTNTKPEKPCVFVTRGKLGNYDDFYDVWVLEYTEFTEEPNYLAIMDGSGNEWGAWDEFESSEYFIIETNCTCKDSTGWTDKPCCNICGKQVEGK